MLETITMGKNFGLKLKFWKETSEGARKVLGRLEHRIASDRLSKGSEEFVRCASARARFVEELCKANCFKPNLIKELFKNWTLKGNLSEKIGRFAKLILRIYFFGNLPILNDLLLQDGSQFENFGFLPRQSGLVVSSLTTKVRSLATQAHATSFPEPALEPIILTASEF